MGCAACRFEKLTVPHTRLVQPSGQQATHSMHAVVASPCRSLSCSRACVHLVGCTAYGLHTMWRPAACCLRLQHACGCGQAGHDAGVPQERDGNARLPQRFLQAQHLRATTRVAPCGGG